MQDYTGFWIGAFLAHAFVFFLVWAFWKITKPSKTKSQQTKP